MLPTREAIEAAAALLRPVLPPTPQISWPLLNRRVGAEVWVKHENHQPVGAFKVRGGLVMMDALARRAPALTGVISATRGNHGQSLAFAAARHGIPAVIVVPEGNSREKNAAMQALGAELVIAGRDFQDAADHAALLADERGLHRIPAFDPLLVTGVATCGFELLRTRPELHTVYVPIGMGSGICGMAAAREALGLKTRIVGVVSVGAPAYALSFVQRKAISTAEAATELADGMACRTPVTEALEVIWRHVERIVTVTDEEVAQAMRALFVDTHNAAEGAGAAALAALLQERARMTGKQVGIILSGANVDSEVFSRVLAGGR